LSHWDLRLMSYNSLILAVVLPRVAGHSIKSTRQGTIATPDTTVINSDLEQVLDDLEMPSGVDSREDTGLVELAKECHKVVWDCEISCNLC
jgi:hypothetical protein